MLSEFEEAKRVKNIAMKTYPPGKLLTATFKKYGKQVDIRYYSPQDIPLTVPDRYARKYDTLYLWSVKHG